MDTFTALSAEIVDDETGLAPYLADWDEIAVASSQPYAAPAWMLAWWRHARPSRAVLRVVVVFDGNDVVAIAPFFAERTAFGRWAYRLLGARCSSRVDLAVRPGSSRGGVADAVVAALRGATPRCDMILFDGVARSSPSAETIAEAWDGGSGVLPRCAFSLGAPAVSIAEGGFDDWYAGKSKNFRQEFRRRRRQLEALGAEFRLVGDVANLPDELATFAQLHRARWRNRGGSRVLTPRVERMLLEAGPALMPQGRFRLWSIDVEGRSISSHVFLHAGERTTYWLGGFDDAWGRYHPAMLTLLAALEHDVTTGNRYFDLGTGDQPYKGRLANHLEYVEWISLAPGVIGSEMARLRFARQRLRMGVAQRLPDRGKDVVRRVMSATNVMSATKRTRG
jgi:CelD/BcsL family acetyltransferase involved in cellulose biosynthesis